MIRRCVECHAELLPREEEMCMCCDESSYLEPCDACGGDYDVINDECTESKCRAHGKYEVLNGEGYLWGAEWEVDYAEII